MTTTFSVAEAGVKDIAEAVAKGNLTPSDVLESVIDRIEATEEKIQAWSQLDLDRARAEAAALTAEAKAGKLRGPLHGVPVGIKEWFHVEGFPTLLRGDDAPLEPEDATVVARLRAAGAIIVGKTHTPLDGKMPPTRNPWNLEHTAGGSSSGSGAVVGARVVPIAIGEQTTGSNLRPAAFNGVEGVKPTYGRISRFGCYPGSWGRDNPGLIGLTMNDMALVLSVVSGFDPKDPTSLHDEPPSADLKMNEYGAPRVGVVRNFYPERTEPVMLQAIETSASRMAAAGASVKDVLLPPEFGLIWHASDLMDVERATFQSEKLATKKPGRLHYAEMIPGAYYVQARRIRTWISGLVQQLIREQELDALLMAVAPGGAPRGLHTTGTALLLTPWSALGFPAVTVNGGLSPEGLPLGLQFVGVPRSEWSLMRLGAWCETTLGRLPAPPLLA